MKKMAVFFVLAAATLSQAYMIPWVSYDNFNDQLQLDASRWFTHTNSSTSIYVDPLSETAKFIAVHNGGLPAQGELVVAEHNIFGVKADMRIEPTYNQASVSELVLKVKIRPDMEAFIGLYGNNQIIQGKIAIRSDMYGDIIPPIFFDAQLGRSYNLAVTVLEHTSQVGFYKDGQMLAGIPFPGVAFNDAAFEVKALGGWTFASIDNVEVIPEPATMLLAAIGGLILRRNHIWG